MIKRDKDREIRWGREGDKRKRRSGTARKGGPGM